MSRTTQLALFFVAIICMSSATGIHDSIFNNFLVDKFNMSTEARGWLELPRETPGFLVFLTSAVLAALPITRVGLVGTCIFALGMTGLAVMGNMFGLMLVMMFIGSTGMHLLQPVTSSIALGMSDEKGKGKRMGQMGMVDTLGVVMGTGFVWLVFDKVSPQYRLGFACAAVLGVIAGVFYMFMHVPHLHKPRARMVFHRKYSLYYLLETFFGARKQIFITFGPWVLIRVYNQPAKSMAGLLMVAAIIGIVFKPIAGLAIDYVGERTIMILDGCALFVVCIGYGYAVKLTSTPEHARLLACSCFIADNLLFALGSCRPIYLSRIAESPQDLNSTLALGVSMNHVVSMSIPALAGLIWSGFGYERVFLCASFLALIIAGLSTFVPKKARTILPVAAESEA